MSLLAKLKYMLGQKTKKPQKPRQKQVSNPPDSQSAYTNDELEAMIVDLSLKANLAQIKALLGHNVDLVIREFVLGDNQSLPAALIYIDNLINPGILDREIMNPLLDPRLKDSSGKNMLRLMSNGGLISRTEIKKSNNFQDIIMNLLIGEVIIFVDSFPQAFVISCKGYKLRTIPEPVIENSVRGPREGLLLLTW